MSTPSEATIEALEPVIKTLPVGTFQALAPFTASLVTLQLHQYLKDLVPDSQFWPGPKPLMQRTARDTKPVAMHDLPWAAGPQDIPDPVKRGTIRDPRAARSGLLRLGGI